MPEPVFDLGQNAGMIVTFQKKYFLRIGYIELESASIFRQTGSAGIFSGIERKQGIERCKTEFLKSFYKAAFNEKRF